MYGLTFQLEIRVVTFKFNELEDTMTFLGTLDCFLILSQFNSGYYNTPMNTL
jgi:hypothetical protein